jgi:polysaccharide biosynthesis protein PslJ
MMFGLYPLWWLVGVVDVMWYGMALVMLLYLRRRSSILAPRGFGVWLFFLVVALISMIELDTGPRIVGFGYRYGIYLACTVLLIYVYNDRETLSARFLTGLATGFWLVTVAGGYLGLLLPTAVIATPMSKILPQQLVQNELVNQMVVRRFAQYNPESYFQLDPRPSAPFLYTNNWGNVYSLLLPLVIAYLILVRRERRFWPLVAAIPVSLVPAFLTLNRGMFIGLGLSLAYVVFRLVLLRQARGIVALVALAAVVGGVFLTLPVADRLTYRVENSGTNTSRASLYAQVVESTWESPFFGQGAPRPSETANTPPVGTQGQLWQVLYSHGVAAAMAFIGWFLLAFVTSLRRRDPVGLAANCILLVGTVETLYYGLVPNGLPLMMIAAGLALRGQDSVGLSAQVRQSSRLDQGVVPAP